MSFPAVLQHRDFVALWAAQVVSRIGDSIHEIALVWIVYEVTGSPVVMSAVVVASLGTSVLFSLPAGSLVDRFNRKYVLIGTDLIRGAVVLAIPLIGPHRHLVPIVVLVAVVSGLMEAFAGPARSALIPNLVPEAELDSANALQRMTTSASQTLYVVGGVVVGVAGSFSAFYADSASFVLSAVLLVGISRAAGEPDSQQSATTGVMAEAREAITFIREDPLLPTIIALSALTGFALGPLAVVLPVFAETVLGRGSTAFGILYGSIYLGVMLGGMGVGGLSDKVGAARGAVITGGTVLTGLSLVLVEILPQRTPFAFLTGGMLLVACGIAIALIQVPLQTIVQSSVPDERRGRVFSVMTAAGLATPPVSVALTGLLLAQFGVVTVLLAEGAFIIISGLLISATPLAKDRPGAGASTVARND